MTEKAAAFGSRGGFFVFAGFLVVIVTLETLP